MFIGIRRNRQIDDLPPSEWNCSLGRRSECYCPKLILSKSLARFKHLLNILPKIYMSKRHRKYLIDVLKSLLILFNWKFLCWYTITQNEMNEFGCTNPQIARGPGTSNSLFFILVSGEFYTRGSRGKYPGRQIF